MRGRPPSGVHQRAAASRRAAGPARRRSLSVDGGSSRRDGMRSSERLRRATAEAGLRPECRCPALRRQLDLPDDRLVGALVRGAARPGRVGGRVRPPDRHLSRCPASTSCSSGSPRRPSPRPRRPSWPSSGWVAAELAHACRAGLLTRLAEGVYVAAGSVEDGPRASSPRCPAVHGQRRARAARAAPGASSYLFWSTSTRLDAPAVSRTESVCSPARRRRVEAWRHSSTASDACTPTCASR